MNTHRYPAAVHRMQIVKNSRPSDSANRIRPVRLVLGVIGLIGIIVTLFNLLFGFVSIPTNSVGVKIRFGAYHSLANPGLNYAIPYVDEIIIVPTQRLLKLEFGFASEGATNVYQGDRDGD